MREIQSSRFEVQVSGFEGHLPLRKELDSEAVASALPSENCHPIDLPALQLDLGMADSDRVPLEHPESVDWPLEVRCEVELARTADPMSMQHGEAMHSCNREHREPRAL